MAQDSTPYLRFKIALRRFGGPTSGLNPEQQARLDDLVAQEQQLHGLILSRQEAGRIVVGEETVGHALGLIIGRYDSREEFERDLARHGMELEDLVRGLREELAVGAVLELVGDSAPRVGLEEARAYYQDHAAEFTRPEQRTVRQILITISSSGPPENLRPNSRARLEAIRARLLEEPSRFGDEAAAHSECPSALNRGLLGTVSRGTLYPRLDRALFSLARGEISGILETELGFHLLRCDGIEPAQRMAWEDVSERIRERLQDRARRRHVRSWLREISSP